MRRFRKRKADESSAAKPVTEKIRIRKSNPDVGLKKTPLSIKCNNFLQEIQIVLDRTVVKRYLDSKDFLRSRLKLNSNGTSAIEDSELSINESCENLVNHVESYTNPHRTPPEEQEDFAVKLESIADANNDLCTSNSYVCDSPLVKQEFLEEKIDVENPTMSENNLLDSDDIISTEQQPNNFSLKDEDPSLPTAESMKMASTDAAINSNTNSSDYFYDDEINIDEEFKSEDVDWSCSTTNNEKELQTHNENQSNSNATNDTTAKEPTVKDVDWSCSATSNEKELQTHNENQSNSNRTNDSTAKKPTIKERKFYYCNHCDRKSISRVALRQHINNVHINKDDYIPCKRCSKKFKTDRVLKLHEKVCGTKYYVTCKFCPKIICSRFVLRRHIISQHHDNFKMEQLDKIMKEIVKGRVRRDAKQMAEVLKDTRIWDRKSTIFDRQEVIKMFCSKCEKISERGTAVVATNCPTCGTTLMFQCQLCKKCYDKVNSLRSHVKWSCDNAEAKIIGNGADSSPKNLIIHAKLENLQVVREIVTGQDDSVNHECKQCNIKKKDPEVCKHIEYRRAGCRYEKGSAFCPKCRRKFKLLESFKEHSIFCRVEFHYACPFCHYTTNRLNDVQKHMVRRHPGKFNTKKWREITDEIRNDRDDAKEKYIAECRSRLGSRTEISSDSPSNHSEEKDLGDYYCRECKIKKKDSAVCKHIEYQQAGCRYEDGFAVCPKCKEKFESLESFKKHDMFCGTRKRRKKPEETCSAECKLTNDSQDFETSIRYLCSNCRDKTYDVSKVNTFSKPCPKCKDLMKFQCQRCGKLYAYAAKARKHVKLCEEKTISHHEVFIDVEN